MPFADSKYVPMIALVTAVFLWASSFIVLKIALAVYDPMIVIFGRMMLASLCIIFFLPSLRKQKFQKGDFKLLVFMAFCEPCMYFIFESHAMLYTSASEAGMIVAALPLLMAVSARFILGEKLSRKTLLGFVLAVTGGIWLSIYSSSTESSPNPALGNFLEFLAMCCAVGYMTILKKMTARYSAVFITAFQATMGALFYLPLLALPTTVLPTEFHPAAAFSIVYLGIGITLGAYGLYNYGMSRLPASQTSAYVNLIPVFTLIMGWTILDEKLNTMQLLAAGLVMFGVILSQDHRSRKKPKLAVTPTP